MTEASSERVNPDAEVEQRLLLARQTTAEHDYDTWAEVLSATSGHGDASAMDVARISLEQLDQTKQILEYEARMRARRERLHRLTGHIFNLVRPST